MDVGVSLFGSIFGFAILKPLSKALPERFGGGYFGPKENVCCQSAATAAGSLGLLFTSGFPAAYQLGLLGANPPADFGRIITFTLCCAYVGIFFTMPLRRHARKKTWGLIISFFISISWRVASEYAPGIMWDWHWAYWFYKAGWKWIICAESWVRSLGYDSMILDLPLSHDRSVSFFGGSLLAWAIIGPALITTGKAVGVAISPHYPGYINYANMLLDDPVHSPSPKYWMIWPGCWLLLCASMAEIGVNYKPIFVSISLFLSPLINRLRPGKSVQLNKEDGLYDPTPIEEQTPWWLWIGGLTISTILSMLIMRYQFGQNAGVTFLAVIFSFIFSLVGAECTGRLDITPVTTFGNFAQLIFGGISKGAGMAPAVNQLNNGLTGMITLAASEQCSDMLGDLKTTHLIGASPRVQLYAQCFGALVSIFLSAGMYLVFVKAYPCINELTATTCSFPAPDVGAWRAVSVAVSSPSLPIPLSSGVTALCLGGFAIVQTIVKYRYFSPDKHKWFPNWNAVGIAMILGPLCTYPMAMLFGSTVALVWRRYWPAVFMMYGYSAAAGMIAGEGLGGIINAVLQIAGVSGSVHGTSVGCPMGEYCG
ncbi:OPT oligopeptide transporter protein-domain-containing protein [Sparassis latifolia]